MIEIWDLFFIFCSERIYGMCFSNLRFYIFYLLHMYVRLQTY